MKMFKIIPALLIGLMLFSSCVKESLTALDEVVPNEVTKIQSIDQLKVGNQDGVLKFNNSEEFYSALNILDTVSLEARKTWETEMGFRSIRTVYEEVMDKFYNDEAIDRSQYKNLISFEGDIPMLLDYTMYTASALNEEGLLIMRDAIGTLRKDGCYWAESGEASEVKSLLETKKSDAEKGLFAFEVPASLAKACTGGLINVSYDETHVISNGNSRGSSELQGWLTFNYHVMTLNSSFKEVKVFLRMRGVSRRKGRRRWSNHRANHTFSWNFRVIHEEYEQTGPSIFDRRLIGTSPRTYQGSETHNNNQEAVKEFVFEEGIFANQFVNLNIYILDRITSGTSSTGTFQTTNYLTPAKVIYGCN